MKTRTLLALIAGLTLLVGACTHAPAQPAPRLEGLETTVDVDLSRPGATTVLVFGTRYCGVCAAEASRSRALARNGDVRVVAVLLDAERADAVAFAERHRIAYPVAWDPNYDVASHYGVRATPAAVVISADGRLLTVLEGPEISVEAALERAKRVPPPQVRTDLDEGARMRTLAPPASRGPYAADTLKLAL